MDDTIVFIDAGFLSKLSKHFGNGKYLIYDLVEFSRNLSKKQNLSCKKIFYYTASPFLSPKPSFEEIKKKKDYDTFTSAMKKYSDFIIREGRCQRLKINNKFKYSQKGVDALMVMDLMDIVIDYPQIKKIILIATDSDFVPVIKKLKERKISTILYTYYEKGRKAIFSTSNQLIQSVNKYVLLTKNDFTSYPLNKKKNK
ncbi:MAG: NYN domain-containing protein [Nanoarchaeota archaeon]|nr:NYN domain-containing protein [Nanoarchaeota archaeon]